MPTTPPSALPPGPADLDPASPIAPGPVVREAWYALGFGNEFGTDAPVSRWVLGEPLAVYRTADGELVALQDRCAHRGVPLSLGRIEGNRLRCMYHGLCYDAEGRCVETPGQARVTERLVVRRYPVCERHGWVWAWMGRAETADTDLVPPVVGIGDALWSVGGGAMEYEANHRLVHDNLCDLSHIAFVHAKTFGGGDERRTRGYAATPARVERLPRGIRVSRWMPGRPVPPFLAPAAVAETVDAFQTYDYLVPGVLLMRTSLFPAGTAQAHEMSRAPGPGALHENFTSQSVTPMTDRRTRYCFTWGPAAHEGRDGLAEVMVRLARAAFEEDRHILEAQQRMLEASPAFRPTGIVHDRGLGLFRSVVADLARSGP